MNSDERIAVKLMKMNLDSYKRENEKLIKILDRISGMCGTPDAVKGCRNILKLIKEFKNEK